MALAVADWRARAQRYLDRDLWRPVPDTNRALEIGRNALQVAVIVAQGATGNQMLLRASALTYFSLLSLIPLIALALAVVEAFGVRANLAGIIVERITAGSPGAAEVILPIIEGVDLSGLGALGAATLVVTTILQISSVERAFNVIWGVEHERSLARRFADYLAVVVVAPLLLAVGLSLGTTMNNEALVQRLLEYPLFAQAHEMGLRWAPGAVLTLAFAFAYWFLPNTRVRPLPALIGGVVAAIGFTVAQEVYVSFNVGAARANAVFGAFAVLPLLIAWLSVSWTVVLLGAEFSFATQNLASFRMARLGEEPSPAGREAYGLAVAARIARSFESGQGVTAETLALDLDIPVRSVRAMLHDLQGARVVSPRGDPDTDGYQLGRAADRITVGEVLAALRGTRDEALESASVAASVEALLRDLDHQVDDAVGRRTLDSLVVGA